ncbi:MAG: hypothetical protein ACXACC_11070 [Promethearchaeota archaeon]|jgi:hypothetical protein
MNTIIRHIDPLNILFSILGHQIEDDLCLELTHFLKKEEIRLKISKLSDSEIQITDYDKTITLKFQINTNSHTIFYDIYINLQNIHLEITTLFNFQKLYTKLGGHGNKQILKLIPDIMCIVDHFLSWTQKYNYQAKWRDPS